MLLLVAAALFMLGALWRLPGAVTDPQKRPLCAACATFASAALIDTDPLYGWVDRTVGVTNLADLIAHCLGLAGVFFFLLVLDGLVGGPSGQRWLLPFLAAAVALCIVTFLLTPQPTETASFTEHYAHEPTITAYWVVSVAFPALCLIQLGRTIVEQWRTPRRALRYGFRVAFVGLVVGLSYAALKIAEVIAGAAGHSSFAAWVRPVDLGLLGAGLSLIAAGLAIPVLDNSVGPVVERWQVRRSLHELDWLWHRLCVEAGAADTIAATSDPELRLLRRVVELRDAQANLWSFLSLDDLDRARAQADATSETTTTGRELEARLLVVALDRELRGEARGRGPGDPVADRLGSARSDGINLRDEIDELIGLSDAVRRASR